MAQFTCDDCGETKSKPADSCGTGYAKYEGDKIVCYACCGKRDKEYMREHGRITLYFVQEKGASWNKCRVTNWPGSLEFIGGYSVGRHNFAGRRYDVWFNGPDGFKWHGVTYGDNTQICHCRRTKQKAA